MFAKNCWYVAAWSSEVPAQGFLARTLCNIPLAFWRDDAGTAVAFEDRCCHRGALLSMGRREANGVRCSYHGLLYDREGTCISAPAQQRLTSKAKVRSFPLVERYKWLWIWLGDPALADAATIPDTHWVDDPAWRCADNGYLHYACNYLLIADNLLDFSHLPFLHPSTLGGSPDYAAVLPKVERLERGVRLTKTVANTEGPAYSIGYAGYAPGAKVDRWMHYDFLAPGVLLMDSGLGLAGTGVLEGKRDGMLAFRGCQALSPETADSTHYFFAHPRSFLLDQSDVTAAIQVGLLTAFEEDRAMIMAQHHNLQRDQTFAMLPMSIDAALTHFRRVMGGMVAAENTAQQPARTLGDASFQPRGKRDSGTCP